MQVLISVSRPKIDEDDLRNELIAVKKSGGSLWQILAVIDANSALIRLDSDVVMVANVIRQVLGETGWTSFRVALNRFIDEDLEAVRRGCVRDNIRMPTGNYLATFKNRMMQVKFEGIRAASNNRAYMQNKPSEALMKYTRPLAIDYSPLYQL
jgi:hypothetical protein